jgi:hypothetical protein
MFELGPAFPTVSTARRLEAVESGCRECKVRSNAGLMRVAKKPALHMASIVVHSGMSSFRIALGCFHPNFLMAVVGESELGDAAVRTLFKCDARTASTGIKKPVGELRQ